MGRDDIGVFGVGGALYRTEVLDFLVVRDDDQSAGVLSGGTPRAYATQRQTFLFGVTGLQPVFFQVLQYKAERGLVGEGADSPGAEHLLFAEHLEKFRSMSGTFPPP